MKSEIFRTAYFAWRKYDRLISSGIQGVRFVDHETGDKYEVRWPA